VIRSILRSLFDAGSREEIERRVCDRLGTSDPHRMAWIGEYSAAEGRIVPRASAGREAGYLDDIEIRIDESDAGQGPAGRAVDTRGVQVARRVTDDPSFGPWREAALERGYESSAAVPIVSGRSLYGVLNVYADRANAFDGEEQAVPAELGEAIGYAMIAGLGPPALFRLAVEEVAGAVGLAAPPSR
jgi:GAF domain-containing protein